jgi:hypothetical protein
MEVIAYEKKAIEKLMDCSFLVRRQVRRCLDIDSHIVVDINIGQTFLKATGSFVHWMVILDGMFRWSAFKPSNAKPFAVPSLAFSIAFSISLTPRVSIGSSGHSSDMPTKFIFFHVGL